MTSIIASVIDRPRGSLADELDRQDREEEQRGFEPEDAFTALVAHLVADGDRRPRAAGRRASRTVAEMHARQSAVMGGEQDDQPEPQRREQEWILDHHRTVTAADDACPLCGYWTCRCHELGYSQWSGSGAQAMTDAERQELEEKVREANKQSSGSDYGKND